MFHVVEFVTNKTVAVVPQSWYEDGCASWPTYNSDERINRAVKHGEEPQDDWQTHDVRIIKSSGMPNLKVVSWQSGFYKSYTYKSTATTV